jgi:hypothetical protein
MVLFDQLNLEDWFSRFGLEGLSASQLKLLIDLIHQRHPQIWSRFRSRLQPYDFSKTTKRKGEAYVQK